MSKYFVSYSWSTFLRKGVGMCILNSCKSIDTVDGLLYVQESIKEREGFRKVVILNYKELGESDV